MDIFVLSLTMTVVVDFFLKQLDKLSKALFVYNISGIFLVMTDASFSENILPFSQKNLCVKSSTETYFRCLYRTSNSN